MKRCNWANFSLAEMLGCCSSSTSGTSSACSRLLGIPPCHPFPGSSPSPRSNFGRTSSVLKFFLGQPECRAPTKLGTFGTRIWNVVRNGKGKRLPREASLLKTRGRINVANRAASKIIGTFQFSSLKKSFKVPKVFLKCIFAVT